MAGEGDVGGVARHERVGEDVGAIHGGTLSAMERDGIAVSDGIVAGRVEDDGAAVVKAAGRLEEAEAASSEAIHLLLHLGASPEEGHPQDLATSLGNLSELLCALGKPAAALEAAGESVAWFREAAAAIPDRNEPNLASALAIQSRALLALGHNRSAIESARDAVAIRRRFAQRFPLVFTADLAGGLLRLADALRRDGEREEALAKVEEAIGWLGQLAADRPRTFRGVLARSLCHRALVQVELGLGDKAAASTREALSLLRGLPQGAAARDPDLAEALNNLGVMMRGALSTEEALDLAMEAVGVYRRLHQRRPALFATNFVASLHNLALCLADLGRTEEAWQAATEGLTVVAREDRRSVPAPREMVAAIARQYEDLARILARSPDAHLLAAARGPSPRGSAR